MHFAEPDIFRIINNDMTQTISEMFNISLENASNMRNLYWKMYGSTLRGLIINHQVNPDEFLKKTHRLEKILKIRAPQYLEKTLTNIKSDKIILTNAPRHYANFVLKKLNIKHYFKKIICIEDNHYLPKPNLNVFRKIRNFPYNKFILVDDVVDNLKAAKKVGFVTINISTTTNYRKYIDINIKQLSKLMKIKRL